MTINEVYMDVPAVRSMAKKFGEIGRTLKSVNKMMENLSKVLQATAFVGFVGGAVAAQYINRIKPYIKKMAEDCEELGKDLGVSVTAYERGDQEGATRFH